MQKSRVLSVVYVVFSFGRKRNGGRYVYRSVQIILFWRTPQQLAIMTGSWKGDWGLWEAAGARPFYDTPSYTVWAFSCSDSNHTKAWKHSGVCVLACMESSTWSCSESTGVPPSDARQVSEPALIKTIGCIITTLCPTGWVLTISYYRRFQWLL